MRQQRAQQFKRTYGFRLPSSISGRRPQSQHAPPQSIQSIQTTQSTQPTQPNQDKTPKTPKTPIRNDRPPPRTSIDITPSRTPIDITPSRSPVDTIDNLLSQIDEVQSHNNQHTNQISNNINNDTYNMLFNTNENDPPSPSPPNMPTIWLNSHNIQPIITRLPTARPESVTTRLDIIGAINDCLSDELIGFVEYYGSNKFRAYYYQLSELNKIIKVSDNVYCIPKETTSFENSNKNSYNNYGTTERLIELTRGMNIFTKCDYIHVVKESNGAYYCKCNTNKLRNACKHTLMYIICDKYIEMDQSKLHKDVSKDQVHADGVVRLERDWQLVGVFPYFLLFFFYLFYFNVF